MVVDFIIVNLEQMKVLNLCASKLPQFEALFRLIVPYSPKAVTLIACSAVIEASQMCCLTI